MKSPIKDGDLIWKPSEKTIEDANLTDYMTWLEQNNGQTFDSYRSLWEWSVDSVDDFWQSLMDYFGVAKSKSTLTALKGSQMPDFRWFHSTELNYAENFFARANEDEPALVIKSEDQRARPMSWSELKAATYALAGALRAIGVQKGDRVAAFLPNIPEAIIALFAAASIGAIWSSCSPDFGSRSVLDRFQQIEPKVLFAVDGYRYNGKLYDRKQVVESLQAELPSLEQTILVHHKDIEQEVVGSNDTVYWSNFLRKGDGNDFWFEQVPFDHPLWVLYSSGTTGLPKPIVQGHGGILLEHLKMTVLHLDLKPGDRFFWYTSTGWMMWNLLVGGLLAGATIFLYDGSPAYPNLRVLWQFADEARISYFGSSAAFIDACLKAGIKPGQQYDLRRIRAVGSTGSPLTSEGFNWIYENVNQELALESISGGADLCTAFVGGCRLLPIYAGEIQAASLGAKVKAYNEEGESILNEVGELVITRPMPSMPLFFWNDPEKMRYKDSYFNMFPGVWRHGDWIKINDRGGCIIYGRSDSTINRQGIRMGTSEIYRTIESIPGIVDSLVVDLELLGRESFMPLFVVLSEETFLDDELVSKIKQKLRTEVSPRHVPDAIYEVSQIPYTLSGKKMEVPVKRIMLGDEPEKAANPGAMRNPESIQFFVNLKSQLMCDS